MGDEAPLGVGYAAVFSICWSPGGLNCGTWDQEKQWRFPDISHPQIIHEIVVFSIINHHFGGTPILGNLHNI